MKLLSLYLNLVLIQLNSLLDLNFSKELKVKNVVNAREMMQKVKESLPVDITRFVQLCDFKPKIKKNKLKKIIQIYYFKSRKKFRYFRIFRKK